MTTIKFKRGTSSRWETVNPVLAAGEPGYDTTVKKFKIGDGTSTWTELSYQDTTYTAGVNITINNGEISATDTTYSPFTGATSLADGTSGLVPAPQAGDESKFLCADGTFKTVSSGGGSYTASYPLDIDGNNDISLKIDSNTLQVNANNELEVIGGGGGSLSPTGSATQPIYIDANGDPTATTYSLEKSVPSDAVFTDTTYTASAPLVIDNSNDISLSFDSAKGLSSSNNSLVVRVDGTTIDFDASGNLSVIGGGGGSSYTATAPIAIDANNDISLTYDSTFLEVNSSDALAVKDVQKELIFGEPLYNTNYTSIPLYNNVTRDTVNNTATFSVASYSSTTAFLSSGASSTYQNSFIPKSAIFYPLNDNNVCYGSVSPNSTLFLGVLNADGSFEPKLCLNSNSSATSTSQAQAAIFRIVDSASYSAGTVTCSTTNAPASTYSSMGVITKASGFWGVQIIKQSENDYIITRLATSAGTSATYIQNGGVDSQFLGVLNSCTHVMIASTAQTISNSSNGRTRYLTQPLSGITSSNYDDFASLPAYFPESHSPGNYLEIRKATSSALGVVRPDDSTLKVDANGIIKVNYADPITLTSVDPIINKLSGADITVAPSADLLSQIKFTDVNDNSLGGFNSARFSNGIQATQISAINDISGTVVTGYLNVFVDATGKDYADASAGAKSTIAGWSMPKTGAKTLLFTQADNMNGVDFTNTTGKNGYLYVSSDAAATGSHIIYVKNQSLPFDTTSYGQAGFVISAFIPVAVGQTCQFYYLDNGGTGGYSVYFVEAIGG